MYRRGEEEIGLVDEADKVPQSKEEEGCMVEPPPPFSQQRQSKKREGLCSIPVCQLRVLAMSRLLIPRDALQQPITTVAPAE